jgi:menaquinone-dependent protoporphyrinogen oxidase
MTGEGKEAGMKVLVVYATKHGATRGIAEHITERLRLRGHDVELQEATAVGSVSDYDAFVVGSAAYMGGWLGEATTFVRRHRNLLASRPVWLFSSGPVGPELVDKKGRDVLVASAPKEFAEFDEAIRPRDERVFFGAYDPDAEPVGMAERLAGRFFRMMPEVKAALPAGDYRDWPAVEGWADEIAAQLATEPAAVG